MLLICGIIIYRRRKPASASTASPTKVEKDKQLPKPQPNASKKEVKSQPTKPWKSITGAGNKESEKQIEEQPTSKKIYKPSSFVTLPKSETSPQKEVPKSQNISTPPQKDTSRSQKLPETPLVAKTPAPVAKVSPKITKGMSLTSFKRIKRVERDEAKEAAEFAKELLEEEKRAVEEAKKHMRPLSLNIDKNARSKDEVQKSTETEMTLIKKLCGEVKEIAKASNAEEREERRKEMDKVRSAR